ncbi:MAG: DUF255 domain-containing protein [Clostridia bacterium]|nr:DUF255 domain-containing protein [Clostridia bacterium]
MRVSSVYPVVPPPGAQTGSPAAAPPLFDAFSQDAFTRARARSVPVFVLIGEISSAFHDPSLSLHLRERTIPVHLPPGMRPDVELLCQRAGALFSGEGALPLCALMTEDALPFLAAPLPPPGYPLDPARLYVWLSQADRRFMQNHAACIGQAGEVIRSFRADPLSRAYSPKDASHDLSRALLAIEDRQNGGFGNVKAPLVCALRFLQHAAGRSDKAAHAAIGRALDAMLASALHDPLDGAFFRSTLTADWRAFVPEKPLAINALLAPILLDSGRRSEAVRLLDTLISAFPLEGGGLSPALRAPLSAYAFTPEQVCAAIGSENGLRACRLLGLLRQHAKAPPDLTPSRFSPVPQASYAPRRSRSMDSPALTPTLAPSLTPEDAAFLRRIMPALLRARAAREPQRPLPHVLTEHAALCAAVLAQCGKRLGEPRYIQAAQRALTFLISQTPAAGAAPLPGSFIPISPLLAQATCGASAALALAELTLGQSENMEEYAHSGLRLLGAALHAFVRPDGVVMHTAKDPAAIFPRVPAVYDGELPSPAALLVSALRIAHQMRPQMGYDAAIETIWEAAAPAAHAQPIACASLIDAMNA